jgi:hypothetical protein
MKDPFFRNIAIGGFLFLLAAGVLGVCGLRTDAKLERAFPTPAQTITPAVQFSAQKPQQPSHPQPSHLPAWMKEAAARAEQNLKLAAEGKVRVGMTDDSVRQAWGAPDRINRTRLRGLVREQWVYRDQYVYLENDVVTSIQTLNASN